jgi:hypothetical protein
LRLRLRFAAPIILACSVVIAALALPAGGANEPPAPLPRQITYAGPSTDSRAEFTKAIHAAMIQQWIDVSTWNDAVAENQARAAAEAAQQRKIASSRPVLADSAGTGTPTESASDPEGGGAEAAVRKYFGDIFDQAWGSDHNYGVTRCESGHDPGARNGPNYGLFQISNVHAAEFERVTGRSFYDAWSDPFANAQYARALYDESGGWGPWSCRWAA